MSTTLIGTTRPSADPSVISFAYELAPASYLAIPLGLVAKTETLKSATGAHAKVRITLRDATSAEGKILESLVETLATSLLALSRKVGPAITPKATEADPSCLRCLEQCKLIVVSEDNPFDQIICMLSCPTCP